MAVTPFDPLYPKPHAASKHHGSMFDRTWVIAEVLYCGNRNICPFWLLWPWSWPDDLHIWTWPVVCGDMPHVKIWTSYIKAFKSYHLTDIQTRPKLYTINKCLDLVHFNRYVRQLDELWHCWLTLYLSLAVKTNFLKHVQITIYKGGN